MKYIMVAKSFPTHHPKAGQPTGFRESILAGRKIHTLRKSAVGRKTGDIVSLRQWAGRPYASKQVEFARCRIAVNRFEIQGRPLSSWIVTRTAVADGFDETRDFADWFGVGDDGLIHFDGVCIYFVDVKPATEVLAL